MHITTLGIDLAKSVFQLHGVDDDGRVVFRKKVRRGALLDVISGLPPLPDRHGSLCNQSLLGP